LDFTIGEFSRITGLSIKALRLYHEKGILIPGHIDPGTNYRYYDDANVDKAKIIVYLRDMEFALADIKDILSNYNDEANLVDALARQKKEYLKKFVDTRASYKSWTISSTEKGRPESHLRRIPCVLKKSG